MYINEWQRKEMPDKNIITLTIDQDDLGALSICAIRYCHGRQTYMPSTIRSIIRGFIDKISDRDLRCMLRDCEWQEEMDLFGDREIDKPHWLIWKDELKAELNRRKGGE